MALQINQYTKIRTDLTLDNDDLMDLDSTDDVGVSYESAKMTIGNFLAYVNANVNNIYGSDGVIASTRKLTANGFSTTWYDGDVIVESGGEGLDRSFLIKDSSMVIKGIFGLDSGVGSCKIALDDVLGTFFYANDGKVAVGHGTATSTLHVKGSGVGTGTAFLIEDNIGTDLFFLNDNGDFALGRNAISGGVNSVTIGKSAATANNGAVAIGNSAGGTSTGIFNVAIGNGTKNNGNSSGQTSIGGGTNTTGSQSTAIGSQSVANGDGATAIGGGANSSFIDAIAIGQTATTTSNNQLVIGSVNAEIRDIYIGNGVSNIEAVLNAITYHQSGVNVGITDGSAVTSTFNIAGARGTGTGLGGDIIFQTAEAGTTGSTQNALTEVMRIKESQVVNISSIPTSAAGLSSGDIWSNSGILTIV
tara:strand:+ start:736 stop:1989 length:1254 start_codon:yes stop_codon:yes gene_type:complete